MPDFRFVAPFQPTGDQPKAIERLSAGLSKGLKHQVLLGATGTGKTATIGWTIQQHQKPTLVLAHNKTLAAQLYSELRDFFPDNAVEYFVSYFDYYQPEAYLPRSDTYIEKDSSRNDEIDKLRHAATHALFERRDVIIVASVSCIYGLGAPVDYGATVVRLRTGGRYRRDGVLRQLVDLQYSRNDQALTRAKFRVRGDTLELQPAYDDFIVRVQFFGDEVERITELDPLTGEVLADRSELNVYPASHYVTPADKLKEAVVDIEAEMIERVAQLEARGMVLEAERLRQRTTFDLEMMREIGFCSGIENYSRHLARREAGSRPWTLLDYFPPDWLLVVDESHMTIPQVVGMYKNDRTRKEILVDFGFRLPSALDNRPLTFEEFSEHLSQVVYMSATPGAYELQRSEQTVQQLIRPTGIVDPGIEVRPTEGQIDDLMDRIRERIERGERVLVTTLTKKMAEDLADYLHEAGVKVSYLHSEVDTLELETPYKNIVALGRNGAVLHHVSYGRDATRAESLLLDAGAMLPRLLLRHHAHVGAPGHGDRRQRGQHVLRARPRDGGDAEAPRREGRRRHAVRGAPRRIAPADERDPRRSRASRPASAEEIDTKGVSRAFYPHGLGHSLGLVTHDVGCASLRPRADNPFLRNTSTIAEGQVFTIEPGLYFIDGLLAELRAQARGQARRLERRRGAHAVRRHPHRGRRARPREGRPQLHARGAADRRRDGLSDVYFFSRSIDAELMQ